MKDTWKPPSSKNDGQKHRIELISPAKVQASRMDGFERNGKAWFVATELQSDLRVEVESTHFHLHKFPLLSRSGHLNRLVFESRDTEKDHIKLVDLPGGAEAFELAAKFCYGVSVELTPANVASLRCAAEYLEMTEDLEEGNLISKTEAFMSFVVLASWKDSITVLQSCEQLSPWAENLQIVQRCSESIAWKACTDPKGIRWSFTGTGSADRKQSCPLVCSSTTDDLEKTIPQDWWFEDVCVLNLEYFVRTMNAIKAKGMRADLLGASITHYALKWLPGLLKERSSQDDSVKGNDPIESMASVSNIKEDYAMQLNNRRLLETIFSILPPQKDAVSCNFLLRLLRAANMLNVDVWRRMDLEKRAGMQLEQASVADLLFPSFSHTCETIFDVDLVYRLVQYFLAEDQPSEAYLKSPKFDASQAATQAAKVKVARVLDGFLAEVASDPGLSLRSFQALAEAFPEHSRLSHDGLYKAVDIYLKVHTDLTDADRKTLCRTIDIHKLSWDACVHASYNERLPLQVVVQVLFTEQAKLRNAIMGCPLAEERTQTPQDPLMLFARVSTSDSDPQSSKEGWSLPHTDIRAIQQDIQLMRSEFHGLKSYCLGLQQQLDKVSKSRSLFSWGVGWKKLSKLKPSSLFPQVKSASDRPMSFEAPPPTTPSSFESRRSRWRRNSVS